jgi:type II secretory pathway component PulF
MKTLNDNLDAAVEPGSDGNAQNGLFAIGLIAAAMVAAGATFVVPTFRQLFQGFGADLPLVTRLTLDYYLALWLFPIAVIVVRFVWPDERSRSMAACIVGAGGFFVIVTALTIVMYLPIFKLGQVV